MGVVWNIGYSDKVLKNDIPLLDGLVKRRIKSAIENKLALDPITFGKPLRGSLKNQRSFRVQNYRVLFRIEDETIYILEIGHRSVIYEN